MFAAAACPFRIHACSLSYSLSVLPSARSRKHRQTGSCGHGRGFMREVNRCCAISPPCRHGPSIFLTAVPAFDRPAVTRIFYHSLFMWPYMACAPTAGMRREWGQPAVWKASVLTGASVPPVSFVFLGYASADDGANERRLRQHSELDPELHGTRCVGAHVARDRWLAKVLAGMLCKTASPCCQES